MVNAMDKPGKILIVFHCSDLKGWFVQPHKLESLTLWGWNLNCTRQADWNDMFIIFWSIILWIIQLTGSLDQVPRNDLSYLDHIKAPLKVSNQFLSHSLHASCTDRPCNDDSKYIYTQGITDWDRLVIEDIQWLRTEPFDFDLSIRVDSSRASYWSALIHIGTTNALHAYSEANDKPPK